MAGTSLLALIDDIATLLDDVTIMSKVAMKKTAGVLGDDLALNAEQVTGVAADRELAVVWAVAKGSAVNKAILVPAALATSALLPSAITPLLMVGGLFLCYEGVEKLAHKLLHSKEEDDRHHGDLVEAVANPTVDILAFEREKIRGAIRTDFILSAEIIVISLGAVAEADFVRQVGVLTTIAVVMTIGVYGLVAGIVKLDDLGLRLGRQSGTGAWSRAQRAVGAGILKVAPLLMKFLSVAGMIAMFLVGGGIITHGVGPVHHWIESVGAQLAPVPGVASLLSGVAGVLAGAATLAVVTVAQRIWRSVKPGKTKA